MRRLPLFAGLFLLLLLLLFLMGRVSGSAEQFERYYIALLAANGLFLVVLLLAIGANVVQLIRRLLQHAPGSHLTLRMTLAFVVFAVAPAAVVYLFSLQMLQRGIDSWFDVQVEEALEDALELSRASLDLIVREYLAETMNAARRLERVPDSAAALVLSDLMKETGAMELTLLAANARIIASSRDLAESLVPRLPGEAILRLVAQGDRYVGLDPSPDGALHVRVVLPVAPSTVNPQARILQALYPLPERIGTLTERVQKAVGRYNQLLYLRRPLKQSFMLTLSLVLLLAVLFAAWAAFQWAQRLLEPIRELARGTRAVARGEYGERLAVSRLDDLGMLLQSFNEMTERLAEAREAAEASQRLVERQRAYLETLLENLSSGVVSLDPQGRLRTLNRAAAQILGVRAPERLIGRDIETLRRGNDTFALFIDQLAAQLHGADEECHIQLALQGKEGRKIVMCHGVRLPTGGQVIVFDDVTALIQAQRDAAWAEVARRLAHEIKNPLTPIQLSAERLRRKLLGKLGAEEARILDRATQTIVAQVEAMKSMVNAFGEYARQPRGEVGMVDVNQLVRDVAELYRANAAGARLELDLAPELPKVRADADRLRQVLHNLFNNALEALGERGDGWVRVVTRGSADGEAVEVEVSDNGPGIPEEMLERLFEPYVTSKSRGTGLGLAIVKKIVEEHGGTVWAENRPEGGARLVIRLPAAR